MPASAPLRLDVPEDHPMGEGDTRERRVHSWCGPSKIRLGGCLGGGAFAGTFGRGFQAFPCVIRTIRGPLTLSEIAKHSLILGH